MRGWLSGGDPDRRADVGHRRDPEIGPGTGAEPATEYATSPVALPEAVGAGLYPESVTDAERERRVLVDLLVYAWDRARSPGVHEKLSAGLADVGVSVLRPDGNAFDPAQHEVGGIQPTADPLLHNTIAETELAGFADRGRLVREPVVVVYRLA